MSKQELKYEDKEICKKCGGMCCKKSGCDYFVTDFESMKLEYLDKVLQTGHISIVSVFDFQRLKNGKLVYTPMLYLRERNTNREIVDLFSFKTSCSSLEKDGCHYDLANRPSGGATLIPGPNKTCYSEIDRLEEMKKWIPYQKVLEKLVKRYTRMSVDERIRQDVEKVIYNVITENYQDSSPLELKDIASMIPMLKECFPNEYLNAIKKALPKKNVLALKK